VAEYGTKWPKAVAKITDDLDVLLEFDNYPAEHWVHLRTTNQEAISKPHDTPIRRSLLSLMCS
jgi:transposase-like protein